MIAKKTQITLYITALFLILFSCQKRREISNAAPKNTKAQVEKLIFIADKLYDNKSFDSAFYYYNKAKSLCNPMTDSENFVSTLNNIAEIQRYHGDYDGSELTLTEATPYLKYVKKPFIKLQRIYSQQSNNRPRRVLFNVPGSDSKKISKGLK